MPAYWVPIKWTEKISKSATTVHRLRKLVPPETKACLPFPAGIYSFDLLT